VSDHSPFHLGLVAAVAFGSFALFSANAQDKPNPHAASNQHAKPKSNPHTNPHANPHAVQDDQGDTDLGKPDAFLANARQLTFEGRRSGEGYFSADGSQMIFQSEREEGNPFYQIYLLDFETGDTARISPGNGKTTCAWIHPGGAKAMFASTHADPDAAADQKAEFEERATSRIRKYSWDYDKDYEIYEAPIDGSGPLKNLTQTLGYDAEGAYSPDGSRIVFASNRHAYTEELDEATQKRFDLKSSYLMDIYTMASDGSDVKRLTDTVGYDGGPFYSADGKQICWRRFNAKGDQAEIYTMNSDGSEERQLTQLGAMSWAPFFHPSGEYLIFATNLHGFANFELYLVRADGGEPVRVTRTDGFDSLPSFSPDGKRLSWTSTRTSDKKSQIFLADWDHQAARSALGISGEQGDADGGDGTSSVTGASIEVPTPDQLVPEISAEDLRKHVVYLASDELEGRLTGSKGERIATQYTADMLAAFGMQPDGDDGGFFHEFEFTAGVDLGEKNILSSTPEIDLVANRDWRPLSFSATGDIESAGVVFAGYGLEVPDENGGDGAAYSSYFHLDVKDKWVLMLRYLPEDIDKETRAIYNRHAQLRFKALAARKRGARGIIIVSGPNSGVVQQLVPMGFDSSMSDSGIAAISITDETAQKWLAMADKDLQTLQDALDGGEMQAGFTIPDLEIGCSIEILTQKRIGRSVVARMTSDFPDEPALIIGAHIDHLGAKARSGSLARSGEEDSIHNGADDNASGVAGMLEIAQYLADQRSAGKLDLKRDVVFAAWSGEEMGLLGSATYLRDIATAKGDADADLADVFSANLNLDMIGRLKEKLVLQAVGSSSIWRGEIERRNAPVGLPLTLQSDSHLPTDASSFYTRGIPVLAAFTGAHEDYHSPRDTSDKVNYEGAERISKLMGLIARSLAISDKEPDYVEMERPKNKSVRGGMRVYLGTVPDYSQGDIEGVKLSGVGKLGPAQKAGVEGGDVIIGLAGNPIKNIYDYTYALGDLKVGEETTIKVLRDGEEIEMKITPGSRE